MFLLQKRSYVYELVQSFVALSDGYDRDRSSRFVPEIMDNFQKSEHVVEIVTKRLGITYSREFKQVTPQIKILKAKHAIHIYIYVFISQHN